MDDSNRVAVTASVHAMDALRALLESPPPEVAAQMEAHGVVPPLETHTFYEHRGYTSTGLRFNKTLPDTEREASVPLT
jgi:hypothetical protein